MHEPNINKHSSSWIAFIMGSFGVSVLMLVIGIYHLNTELWVKGFLVMGILMVIQNAISLTKTMRDMEEGKKVFKKIEDVKHEKLLAEIAGI